MIRIEDTEEYLRTYPSHIKPRNEVNIDREEYLRTYPSHIKPAKQQKSDQKSALRKTGEWIGESLGALGVGGLQGLTLNFTDEGLATLASPFVAAYQSLTDDQKPFSLTEGWKTAHDWLNDWDEYFYQSSPLAYPAANILGSIAATRYAGSMAPTSSAAHLARLAHGVSKPGATAPKLALLGGASGAVSGFGSGTDLESRTKAALSGGLFGAGLGGGLGWLGGKFGSLGSNAPLTPNVTDIPTAAVKQYGRALNEAGVSSKPGAVAEAAQQAGGEHGRILDIQSGMNKRLETAAQEQKAVNDLFKTALEDVKIRESDTVTRSVDTHLPTIRMDNDALDVIDDIYTKTVPDFVDALSMRHQEPAAEIFEQLKYKYVDQYPQRETLNQILTHEDTPDEVLRLFFDEYRLHKNDVFTDGKAIDATEDMMQRARYFDDGITDLDIRDALLAKDIPLRMSLDFHLLHRFQNTLDNVVQQYQGKVGYTALKKTRDELKDFINSQTSGYIRPAMSIDARTQLYNYADAMKSYHLAKSSQDAIENGRKALSSKVSADEVEKAFTGLKESIQQQAYKVGMRNALLDKAKDSPSMSIEINDMLKSHATMEKFRVVFGRDEADVFKKSIEQQARNRTAIPDVDYTGKLEASQSLLRRIGDRPLSIFGHILESISENVHDPKVINEGLAKLSLLKPGDISDAQAIELLQHYIKAAERGQIGKEQFQKAFFEVSKLLTKADIYNLRESGLTEKQAAELRAQYGMQ